MITLNRAIVIPLSFVVAFACQNKISGSRRPIKVFAGSDSGSVVRFFYQPNPSSYFHVALLFRAVNTADPKWNTAQMYDVGRTAYITGSEMDELVKRLSNLPLSWTSSKTVEPLETYKTIHSFGGMNVKVLTRRSTAKASIRPETICATLAPLDKVLHTPRALWEFQLFRIQYHCKVPNFNPQAYPDRIP